MPKTKNYDWLVTTSGWRPSQSDNIAVDTVVVIPLSYSHNATAAALGGTAGGTATDRMIGTFESGDNWTLEAVVGELRWQLRLGDTEQGSTWRVTFQARLEVFQADELGDPIVPVTYTLDSPIQANRSFLWHRGWATANQSTWTGTQYRAKDSGMMSIRCQAKRRIQTPDECVALVIQYTEDLEWLPGASTPPRLHWDTAVRVLASKYM